MSGHYFDSLELDSEILFRNSEDEVDVEEDAAAADADIDEDLADDDADDDLGDDEEPAM